MVGVAAPQFQYVVVLPGAAFRAICPNYEALLDQLAHVPEGVEPIIETQLKNPFPRQGEPRGIVGPSNPVH